MRIANLAISHLHQKTGTLWHIQILRSSRKNRRNGKFWKVLESFDAKTISSKIRLLAIDGLFVLEIKRKIKKGLFVRREYFYNKKDAEEALWG